MTSKNNRVKKSHYLQRPTWSGGDVRETNAFMRLIRPCDGNSSCPSETQPPQREISTTILNLIK